MSVTKVFFRRTLATAAVLLCGASSGVTQPAAPQTSAPTMQPPQIVDFLSHTINWYRQLAAEQQLATEPSDVTFLQENRRVADQVVQLAFDYARTQAQLQAKQASRSRRSTSGSIRDWRGTRALT